MAQVWAVIKFLQELWVQIKIFIGMIEKAKHEHANEEIKDKTDIAGDPEKPVEDRLDAIKEIEDSVNNRT